MSLSRKDYELIARAVRSVNDDKDRAAISDAQGAIEQVAIALSDELETTNERFDRVRFLEACGVRP